MTASFSATYLRRHIALPGEHGSWVFLLSPLLIGLFAGGSISIASVYLIVAAMAAFLIRQPVTIAIKAYSGRRSRRDLPAARFWMLVYAVIGLLGVAGLVVQGFAALLILALPGIPVFLWHLYLVSRRQERRQVGVEVVGSGVLALAAPAAYWVGLGPPAPPTFASLDPFGWWLFAAYLVSIGSIHCLCLPAPGAARAGRHPTHPGAPAHGAPRPALYSIQPGRRWRFQPGRLSASLALRTLRLAMG